MLGVPWGRQGSWQSPGEALLAAGREGIWEEGHLSRARRPVQAGPVRTGKRTLRMEGTECGEAWGEAGHVQNCKETCVITAGVLGWRGERRRLAGMG